MERIRSIAHHDYLTDLPNRVGAHDCLDEALTQARRRFSKVAVLSLDLDRFHLINETLGFLFGDLLLQSISERLKGILSEGDSVARVGDDEFVMILAHITEAEEAVKTAQKVREELSGPHRLKDHQIMTVDFRITASIGIALSSLNGDEAETLLKNANSAMMQAKREGGDCCRFYTAEMNAAILERLTLESGLRDALQRDELFLEYQPQLDLLTGRIVCVEALVRWNDPGIGVIPPSRFIPLAEEMGLIGLLGQWVLETACAQNKKWQWAGLPPIRVAINLSAYQLQQKSLVETVKRVLKETELGPAYLEFEITETTMMRNIEETVATLYELKEMGIRISIDDFGAGYSSLTYLRRFPIDVLKIDRSFLVDISGSQDDMAIMIGIMDLARRLKLRVVAEGVETEAQLDFLRRHGCDAIQGFLLSPPLPAEAITKLLRGSQSISGNGPAAYRNFISFGRQQKDPR